MRDPWKYIAFPLAAVIGYLASLGLTTIVAENINLAESVARFLVIGGTGLLAGFMIDEVIPAYIEKLREGGSGGDLGGGGDFGGGGDDFGGDMDFD